MTAYDTLNEPIAYRVCYDPTAVPRYQVRPTQALLLGRYVQPDPDAQLAPDSTLFARRDNAEQIAAVREAAARKAAATDQRIHDYLRRRGPRTVSAIRSELGMSSFGVRSALSRRPDLFVTAGETRGKKGMATLWHIRQEA